VIGEDQAPDTLFGFESQSLATSEVLAMTGLCYTTFTYDYQPTYCYKEFPKFDNGGAVTKTVEIDPAKISVENPIVVAGTLITSTAEAKNAGIEIPKALPQLTTTYKLNPDLKWEDGTPVTSADVVQALRVYKDPTLQAAVTQPQDRLLKIDTPDPQTVVQIWAPGYLDFDYFLYLAGGANFVPAHKYKGKSIEEIRQAESNHPMSYGPYMVQEHKPNESVTLVNNPYHPKTPKIGTVIWKFVPDTNQLLAQLESGDIDYVDSYSLNLAVVPQLEDLEKAGKIKAEYVPASAWEHLDFGIKRGDDQPSFFDDVNVRHAVAYGINRQEIVDKVLYGKTTVMNTYVPADHPSFPKSGLEEYKYDPEKAKQLLDQAGWQVGADGIREKDGRKFAFTLYTTEGNETRKSTVEVVQQNLKDVGIDVKLEYVPGPAVLFKNGADGLLVGRRFDMALYAWISSQQPSHDLYKCDQIPTKENNYTGQNSPGYCNPDFDKTAKLAQTTLDDKQRAELDQVPETIFNKDLPVLPLYQRLKIGAYNPAVSGIKLNPTQQYDIWNGEELDINK